jgi:hypothetical protein
MPDDAIDAALDELYGVDPGDFVATRKRLAAELRAGGDKGAATDLGSARRPSTAAWALNQLARHQPALVQALLARGRELLAAQMRAVSGQPDALREAIRAHRDALTDAVDSAVAMLGNRANDGFRGEITSTLRAASVSDAVGEQLRTGRLIHEVTGPGFPEAVGLRLVPAIADPEPKAAAPPATRGAERASDRDEADARARRREREREREEKREREARRRADLALQKAALRRAESADAEAARAQAKIDRLESDLEAARDELRRAAERSREARDEAARFDG